MKKTVFTICSVLTVCAVIIMSCEKEDTSATKVYYNSQPGYNTGGNPNPNGVATSGGSATTTGTSSSGTSTTTGATCANSQSSNGVTGSSVTATGGVNMSNVYQVNHNSTVGTVLIIFSTASAPTAGQYTIVSGTPAAGQCSFSDYGFFASGGVVTVAGPMSGAANGKITYSGIVASTYTITGTACY